MWSEKTTYGNRRTDWKVASRLANMERLLPLGACPRCVQLGEYRLKSIERPPAEPVV